MEWDYWDEDWMDDDEKAAALGIGLMRDPEAEAMDSYTPED